MNISDIEKRIQELEKRATFDGSEQELASLYIIQMHLQNSTQSKVAREIDDILPTYRNYIKQKTEYQRHNVGEEKILYALDLLCAELREFLEILYSSTNLYKERRKLQNLIECISAFYKD